MASRRVNIQFLNLPDTSIVRKVQELDYQGIPFDSIHSAIWGVENYKRDRLFDLEGLFT